MMYKYMFIKENNLYSCECFRNTCSEVITAYKFTQTHNGCSFSRYTVVNTLENVCHPTTWFGLAVWTPVWDQDPYNERDHYMGGIPYVYMV